MTTMLFLRKQKVLKADDASMFQIFLWLLFTIDTFCVFKCTTR